MLPVLEDAFFGNIITRGFFVTSLQFFNINVFGFGPEESEAIFEIHAAPSKQFGNDKIIRVQDPYVYVLKSLDQRMVPLFERRFQELGRVNSLS